MAEFSKQWCEKFEDYGIRPDFDILEIANGLDSGYYTSVICEGFGFIAVSKDDAGNIMLAMPSHDYPTDGSIVWKNYDDVINA